MKPRLNMYLRVESAMENCWYTDFIGQELPVTNIDKEGDFLVNVEKLKAFCCKTLYVNKNHGKVIVK
jgi:hypothetical protein